MTDITCAASTPGPSHARGLMLVFLAGVLYASAGLFTRALPFDLWTLLAWRSFAGGAFTALAFALETGRFSWRDYAMGPAHWMLVPVGAVATACYVAALKLTTVADVMIVYATTPFVTAIVAWLWNKEVPSRRMLVASSLALVGVAVMLGGAAGSPGRLIGSLLMMLMNVSFALMLVLARRHPQQSMLPTMTLSLVLVGVVGLALAPRTPIDPPSMLLMVVFGVVTVGFAMTLFMAGARQAPSSEVALVGISDVVLGPLMVFFAYGENPGRAAVAGGVIVAVALGWNVWPEARRALRARRHGI